MMDGTPLQGSTVSRWPLSFSLAIVPPSGTHSFTIQISCPIIPTISGPGDVLQVSTRTLAVQNLG